VWIVIAGFFLAGICLVIWSNKLVSWWINQHKHITDNIEMFKPVAGYQIYYKVGPIAFRILGILLIGFSITSVFIVLYL
jgi:hypothetical protein